MIYIIVHIGIFLLFAFTKSQRDLIGSSVKWLFKNSKWYNTKDYKGFNPSTGKIHNKFVKFLYENVTTFMGNGWHLNDFINVSLLYFLVGYNLGDIWYGLIFLIVGGTFHSIINGSLFRRL